MNAPEPAALWPNAPLFLVTTMQWSFMPGDSTGLANPASTKDAYPIVDGPYSSYARAEMAADRRLSMYRSDFYQVEGLMTVGGSGSWHRTIVWHDNTGIFGDEKGWQMIERVALDRMPN